MHFNAVNAFFFRPFFAVSRYCTDKLLKVIEKVRPFSKSILGNVAKCAVAETVCGIAGSMAGGIVGGRVCQRLGSMALAGGTVAGGDYAYHKNRKALLALAITAGIVQCVVFSEDQQAAGFLIFGEWAGSAIGTILGGYAGLKLAGSRIDLIDRVTPTDSYTVNMIKHQAVEEVFEAVIVKSSLPYVSPIFNLPRYVVKAILKTSGYNSQFLVPVIRKSFQERKLVPTVPLILKMLTNRYCVDNSSHLAAKVTKLLSLKMLPTILQKGMDLLSQTALLPQIKASIEFLGKNTDILANVTMRSLLKYVEVVKRIDHKNLKAALKEAIPFSTLVSPVFDLPMKEKIRGWANSIVDSIREMEVELTGYQLLTDPEIEALRFTLTVHLKYYVIYTLLNCNNLTDALSPIEERDFFNDLNNAFFAIYTHESRPNRVAQALRKTTGLAIDGIHKLRRFIEQAEQNTGVFHPAVIIQDFHPQPLKPAAKPLFDDAVEM
jgi:hypothetical protein